MNQSLFPNIIPQHSFLKFSRCNLLDASNFHHQEYLSSNPKIAYIPSTGVINPFRHTALSLSPFSKSGKRTHQAQQQQQQPLLLHPALASTPQPSPPPLAIPRTSSSSQKARVAKGQSRWRAPLSLSLLFPGMVARASGREHCSARRRQPPPP